MRTPQKIFTTIIWATVVLGMLLLVALSTAKKSAPPAMVFATLDTGLPTLFDLPTFKLVDQNGNDFTDANLRGKPFISAFVFTQCAGPCPMMFAKLKAMQKTIPNPDVHLVTFTVDPANDTPPVLKQKAKELEADETRWSFLTGDKDSVNKLMRDMLQPIPEFKDSPLMHDEHFYLFDADGKCRGRYYSKDDAEMTKLTKDAQMLAERKPA